MSREATIQRIKSLEPIPNADAIELATLEGMLWTFVVKKGDFQAGDRCVYFQIDSLLPKKEWSEFMEDFGYRVKSRRFRGALSQGLALPLSIVYQETGVELDPDWLSDPDWLPDFLVGRDVTELLSVKHFEKPIPFDRKDQMEEVNPGYFPKTDEDMIQSLPVLWEEEIKDGQEVYITTKYDGTSMTVSLKDGKFSVCGRQWAFIERVGNPYWDLVSSYGLREVLASEGKNLAIQGELCGPGIQKNKMGLEAKDVFVFDIYDIDKDEYFNYYQLTDFCSRHRLKMVPIEFVGPKDPSWDLLEMAKGNYKSGRRKEGIVVRPTEYQFSRTIGRRLSFKVLNNKFLLKDED